VQELLVIAQDTSAYGVDIRYQTGFWGGRPLKTRFTELARSLGELGVWVRLHYVYPYPHVDEVIPLMAEGKILPYLDIPFQHASPRLLKAMKRPAGGEDVLKRLAHWRSICPEIAVRSTFIVGFPGETADDFQRLLDFLQEAQLDRVGCFTYSPVDGAVANTLAAPVPDEIKQERLERFMAVQAEISAAKLARRIGQRMIVLVDAIGTDCAQARSYADAPEIDGIVHIEPADGIRPGDKLTVEITRSDLHDLYGAPSSAQRLP
jgi:ribosomal protein S12 methylthiotransferase